MTVTARDLEDLVKLLDERPEWRDRLRSILLPEWEEFRITALETLRQSLVLQQDILKILRDLATRLQALTVQVAELATAQRRTEDHLQALTTRMNDLAEAQKALTARVDELAEAQKALTLQVSGLAEAQRTLTARVEELTEAQKTLTVQMDELASAQKALTARMDSLAEILQGMRGEREGTKFEDQIRRAAFGIFRGGRNFRKDVEHALERAIVEGKIDWKAFRRVRATDLLWCKEPQGQSPVLLVAEVSIQVDYRDVDRASQAAHILAALFPHLQVIPVVMGRDWARPEAWEQARLMQVEWWIEKNEACSVRLDGVLKARTVVPDRKADIRG
ncbi:MAG: hypothetical protein NZ742_00930 [Acidobacteria bacterium]|nr:hypothetical protein [Acidobacteriota bacterium]MDW7983304.1 hypothetical protein [Acidobacteriota bacterium]